MRSLLSQLGGDFSAGRIELRLFVPSVDRDGVPIDQEYWRDEALRLPGWRFVRLGIRAMYAREFAEALGGSIFIEMPNRQSVFDSAVTMRMMHTVLHARLKPGRGKRPGRPSNPAWTLRRQVPFSEATWSLLERLAEALSTPERRVSPAQLAATLLEQVLATGAPTEAKRTEGEAEPAAAR